MEGNSVNACAEFRETNPAEQIHIPVNSHLDMWCGAIGGKNRGSREQSCVRDAKPTRKKDARFS